MDPFNLFHRSLAGSTHAIGSLEPTPEQLLHEQANGPIQLVPPMSTTEYLLLTTIQQTLIQCPDWQWRTLCYQRDVESDGSFTDTPEKFRCGDVIGFLLLAKGVWCPTMPVGSYDTLHAETAKLYGVTVEYVASLEDGYCEEPNKYVGTDGYVFGQKLRKLYSPAEMW